MPLALPDIYYTAIHASIKASEAIMRVYENEIRSHYKYDGSPVTQADLISSGIIERALNETKIPILGEELEKQDFEIRNKWKENWCVDPLDGTKMFIQRNGEFCVNIAHIVEGKSVFGIIAAPVNEQVLIGGPEYGVFCFSFADYDQPEKWDALSQHQLNGNPRLICSRSYPNDYGMDYLHSYLNQGQEFEYIRKGSALKFFDLALGTADIYARFAPTMEWDIAAGQAILECLGGKILNVHTNEALSYNKESLFNPHFIATTAALCE